MNQHQPEWLKHRLDLAMALASGIYTQQPPSKEDPPLRDANSRYSADGVAAALTPVVWVMVENAWRAVWMDELMEALPARRSYDNNMVGLSPDEEDALTRYNAGETTALPEVSACHYGLHEHGGHSQRLMVHPFTFPESTRLRLGLPNKTGPYPLNDILFDDAAALIAAHPMCLGPGPDEEHD